MQALYQLEETIKTLQEIFPQPAFELMVQRVIEDHIQANNITGIRAYNFIKRMLKKRKINMVWYVVNKRSEYYGQVVEYTKNDFMESIMPREALIKDLERIWGFDVTRGEYYIQIPKYKTEDYFRQMFSDENYFMQAIAH